MTTRLKGNSASSGVGFPVIGGTEGSVLFVGADEVLAQDNTNLFFNDTTNILTVGGGLIIGTGGAGIDYTLTFNGESDDGVLTYDEDNNILDFGDTGITTSGLVQLSAGQTITWGSGNGSIEAGATADTMVLKAGTTTVATLTA